MKYHNIDRDNREFKEEAEIESVEELSEGSVRLLGEVIEDDSEFDYIIFGDSGITDLIAVRENVEDVDPEDLIQESEKYEGGHGTVTILLVTRK